MSIISLAEQDSHALLKYKSNRGSWKQNHYISNSKCNDGNIKCDSNGADPFAYRSIMPLVLLLEALFPGCSDQSVRVFNEQGLDEQELDTVTTHEDEIYVAHQFILNLLMIIVLAAISKKESRL